MDFQLWETKETITIGKTPQEVDFSAKEVLLSILPEAAGRANGYTIQDLKARKELIEILEQADPNSSIVLNKQHIELLVKRMGACTFPFAVDNLIKLNDNLNQAYVELSAQR